MLEKVMKVVENQMLYSSGYLGCNGEFSSSQFHDMVGEPSEEDEEDERIEFKVCTGKQDEDGKEEHTQYFSIWRSILNDESIPLKSKALEARWER